MVELRGSTLLKTAGSLHSAKKWLRDDNRDVLNRRFALARNLESDNGAIVPQILGPLGIPNMRNRLQTVCEHGLTMSDVVFAATGSLQWVARAG